MTLFMFFFFFSKNQKKGLVTLSQMTKIFIVLIISSQDARVSIGWLEVGSLVEKCVGDYQLFLGVVSEKKWHWISLSQWYKINGFLPRHLVDTLACIETAKLTKNVRWPSYSKTNSFRNVIGRVSALVIVTHSSFN